MSDYKWLRIASRVRCACHSVQEVGRALLLRPKVLLIDEPSIGLSPILVQDVFKLLRKLAEQGTTVLMVEQNILVNAITPAIIHSELVAQMPASQLALALAKVPMGRAGKVDEVAALVCWLSSSECSFSTGAVFDVSGGRATC